MFVLNRIVIHEVIKKIKSNVVTLDLSDTLSDNEDVLSQSLMEKIHTSYNNDASMKNTQFAPDADTPFSTHLKAYLLNASDDNFLNFSVMAIRDLRELIKEEHLASGGYYCFADYQHNGKRFLAVILLRRKDSINFVKVAGTFKAQGGESLNFDKIAMGFRLNVEIYNAQADSRNYISLITTQQDKLSSYFKDWVSVTGIISHEQNTRSLVDLVKQLPIPLNEAGELAYASPEYFRRACFEFVEQSHEKRVSLMDMSRHFYGEGQERLILDFAEEQQITIDNEFKRNLQAWKRVIAIKAEIKGVKLSIDYDRILDNVVDIQENQIVIRSPELVKQIRAQQNG